eukprot:TRINITY_DN6431_c0_g2_i1.p1 TRINITY_DN6431_c0_g2~~TRINITY_DN6431_c0_g2_i1.p1  ORF type:complete len:390 (-),score=91.08 TRINITY_DN6431_c0_g2_i1:10-1179(-)
MKISIKTLAGALSQVETSPEATIAQLKQTIAAEQGYATEGMKLIHKGKVLTDEMTVESVAVTDGDFFVIVGKKAAVVPQKQATEEPKPQPTPAPAPTPVTAPEAPKQEAESTPSSTPQPAAQATNDPHLPQPAAGGADAASAFLTGDVLESTVNSIVDMGFPRDQVLRAMRAAFNNPDRAVEYLMTGIPAHAPQAPAGHAPAPGHAPTPAPAQQGATAAHPPAQPAAGAAQPAAGDLEAMLQQFLQQEQQGGQSELEQALAQIPNFNQIRALIAQNPQLLQSVMGTLQTQSPELFQLIQQNPQEFLRILRDGVGGGGGGGGGAPVGRPGGAAPPGTITVTAEEKAAIDRLASLGFPEALAAEAYFVCNKNEELAANYLFERADEFMGGQ